MGFDVSVVFLEGVVGNSKNSLFRGCYFKSFSVGGGYSEEFPPSLIIMDGLQKLSEGRIWEGKRFEPPPPR